MKGAIEAPAVGAVPSRLRWAVKSSFRRYVDAQHDGDTTTSGVRVAHDFFEFPGAAERISHEGSAVVVRFTGAVTFAAHDGFLNLTLRDPWVTFEHDTARISVLDHPSGGVRQTVATASFEGGAKDEISATQVWRAPAPTLTIEGSHLFGSNYAPGSTLDPVEFEVRTAVEAINSS